jgi:hypothetical protein
LIYYFFFKNIFHFFLYYPLYWNLILHFVLNPLNQFEKKMKKLS